MKKFSKGLIFVATSFIIISVILLALSALVLMYSKDDSLNYSEFDEYIAIALYETELATDKPKAKDLKDTPLIFDKKMEEKLDFSQIHTLNISTNNTDITILKADKNNVKGIWYEDETIKPVFNYKENQLIVKSLDKDYDKTIRSQIIISLDDTDLDSINILGDYANIIITDITCKQMQLKVSNSDVILSNVKCSSFIRNLNYNSKIRINNSNIERLVNYGQTSSISLDNTIIKTSYTAVKDGLIKLNAVSCTANKLIVTNGICSVNNYNGMDLSISFNGKLDMSNVLSKDLSIKNKHNGIIKLKSIIGNNILINLKKTKGNLELDYNNITLNLVNSKLDLKAKTLSDKNITTYLTESKLELNGKKINKNIGLKVQDSNGSYVFKLNKSSIKIDD